MKHRLPLIAFVLAFCALATHTSYAHGTHANTSKADVFGERTMDGWRSDFNECRKVALEDGRPFVLVYTSEKCPHCKALAADIAANSAFKAWRKESGFIFCHVVAKIGKNSKTAKEARTFAATAGGTKRTQPTSFPYVCLYHKDASGKVLAYSFTTESSAEVMDLAKRLFSGVPVPANSAMRNGAASTNAVEVTSSSFCGNYTVQLPLVGVSSNALVRGTASLTMEIPLQVESGNATSVNYSATLPDGSSFAGTVPLKLDTMIDAAGVTSKVAHVDIAGRSSTGSMTLPLKITPFAAKSWRNPSVPEGLSSVFVADGKRAMCKLGTDDLKLAVYGGFFRRGKSPKSLCELFELSPNMRLKVRASKDLVSERFGKVLAWPTGKIVADKRTFTAIGKKNDIQFSYERANGTISGKGSVRFAERTVSGKFHGVILPGWVECHCGTKFTPRPFAAGHFVFKDFVKKGDEWVDITRSVPFEIIAK